MGFFGEYRQKQRIEAFPVSGDGLLRRLLDIEDKERLLVVLAAGEDNGSLAHGKYLLVDRFGYAPDKKEISALQPVDLADLGRLPTQRFQFSEVAMVYIVSPVVSVEEMRRYLHANRRQIPPEQPVAPLPALFV